MITRSKQMAAMEDAGELQLELEIKDPADPTIRNVL